MGDFKPAEIYVGVMELFTVLLPGAFLAAGILFALPPAYAAVLLESLPTNAAQWVAFGFCAYALGAFVFPSAALLDEGYDDYRDRQIAKSGDHAYTRASELRCDYLGTDPAKFRDDDPMNTFRWAKALLMQAAPTAFADVQRYEAESKFFRSLTIALPLVGVLVALRIALRPVLSTTCPLVVALLVLPVTGALMWLSHRRYCEQRFKSTQWAYAHAIVLQMSPAAEAAASPREPWWRVLFPRTHA